MISDIQKSFQTVERILVDYSLRLPKCKHFYVKYKNAKDVLMMKQMGNLYMYMHIHTYIHIYYIYIYE